MSNKGLFRTIFDRLIESRQRAANAYVASYLADHPEVRPTRPVRRG
jgi:hypothetical protein